MQATDDNAARHRNVAAEAALLGGLLIKNEILDLVSEHIDREDFAEPIHGDIYRAILRMRSHGEMASPVTLRPIFEGDDRIDALGGVSYLATLTGTGAGLIGAVDLAKQIAQLSSLRKARAAILETLSKLDDVENGLPDVGLLQGDLETKLWAAAENSDPVQFRNPKGMLNSVLNRVTRLKSGTAIGALNMWITDLNVSLGSLEEGTYHIFAGRPSMGKTVLGVSAMLGYAAAGTPVLYLHAEMEPEQMDQRVICDMAYAMGHKFTLEQIRKGEFTDEEFRQLRRVEERLELMPFQFVATSRCDVAKINSYVARAAAHWKSKGRKLGVVVIDYIQLLEAVSILGARDNNITTARVSAISGALLNIAKRHKVAVIALSQLSRKVEERPDGMPQMSDLRESGRIEEDADSVVLIHRPEYYLERQTPPTKAKDFEEYEALLAASRGKADLIVAKNRHGKAMKRSIKFYGSHGAMRSGEHTEYSHMFSDQHDMFEEPANVI